MSSPPPSNPQRNEAARTVARRYYLDGRTTLTALARRCGVNASTIRRWAAADDWVRGAEPADDDALAALKMPRQRKRRARPRRGSNPSSSQSGQPSDLVARLYGIIEHNISILENKMSDDDMESTAITERDTRALGNIVRSMDKLKDLEPGHGKPQPEQPKTGRAPTTPEEEDRLRMRMVERILKLRERRGGSGSSR